MKILKQGGQLRMFLDKFHERSLLIDDFNWISTYLIFPIGLGPPIVSALFIDSENGQFFIVLKLAYEIFFVPLFIVFLWLESHFLPKVPTLPIRLSRVVLALVFATVFSFVCTGYISLWNALSGSSEEILVSGPVVKMDAYSGRYAGRISIVTIQYNGRDVDLTVTKREYAALRNGDTYSRKMKLGGLGYYYTWGFTIWK